MSFVNHNYKKNLGNVFYKINQKVDLYKKNNPCRQVISLGIGDVTRPFSENLANIMSNAILEQKYKPLPFHFELDNVTTIIWLLKGAFVEQSVVKKILQYLRFFGKDLFAKFGYFLGISYLKRTENNIIGNFSLNFLML